MDQWECFNEPLTLKRVGGGCLSYLQTEKKTSDASTNSIKF